MSAHDPRAGDAKAGLFILRLAGAAAWFAAAWLVYTRLPFDLSFVMRVIIALLAAGMGCLTVVWALFGRDGRERSGS